MTIGLSKPLVTRVGAFNRRCILLPLEQNKGYSSFIPNRLSNYIVITSKICTLSTFSVSPHRPVDKDHCQLLDR